MNENRPKCCAELYFIINVSKLLTLLAEMGINLDNNEFIHFENRNLMIMVRFGVAAGLHESPWWRLRWNIKRSSNTENRFPNANIWFYIILLSKYRWKIKQSTWRGMIWCAGGYRLRTTAEGNALLTENCKTRSIWANPVLMKVYPDTSDRLQASSHVNVRLLLTWPQRRK